MRIALAGISLESSTFGRTTTPESHFSLFRDQELVDFYRWPDLVEGTEDIEFLPVLYALATAGGPLEAEVYDRFEAEIVDGLRTALPLDGVFLDMHGAMTVEGRDRAEERFLHAVRGVVGPDVPVSLAMDPHGNMSEELVRLIDLAACHRHAPHIDRWDTRTRAMRLLVDTVRRGEKPVKAWVPIPSLLHGECTSTVVEPGKSVFGRIAGEIEESGVVDANLWIGFAWADERRNAAAALVTGDHAPTAAELAERIARRYWDNRERFQIVGDRHGSVDEALDWVLADAPRTTFISDSGDNVTAGGTGDTTPALRRVLERSEELAAAGKRILVAGLWDPQAVGLAEAAGVGGRLPAGIGAKADDRFGGPVAADWRVLALIEGHLGEGVVGALLEAAGVRVTVQRQRVFFVDPHHDAYVRTRRPGVAWVPVADYDAVVVKNGYLFPSQRPYAAAHFMAITPGGTDLDFSRVPIRNWRRPVFPLDRDFEPELRARLFLGAQELSR